MPWYLKRLFQRAGLGFITMGFNDDAPGSGGGDGGAGDDTMQGGQGDDGKDGKSGKSGQSNVSDSEAELLREVMDKKKKLREAQDQLVQVNAKLKDFEGLDAGEIRKLIQEKKEREAKELEAKGEWDTLRKQMADAHAEELAAEKKKSADAQTSTSAFQNQIAELTVGNAFGNSQFIAKEMNLPTGKTRTLFGEHFEFDGERVVGYDKPAGKAGRAILVDGSGSPLAFDAALEKLVKADPDAENLLKSKMKTGAGSGSEKRVTPPREEVQLTGLQRIRAGLTARGKK